MTYLKATLLDTLLVFMLFTGMKCEKESTSPDNLPAATQDGKNTLGFLLNGKTWVPAGIIGAGSKLSVNVDLTYKKGVLCITAHNSGSFNGSKTYFGLTVKDSLALETFSKVYKLSAGSLYAISYSDENCNRSYFEISPNSTGSLTISKLDKSRQIISGVFNARLVKTGCETVEITEGRFDMKY